jgi:hypothetical protein
MAVVLDKQLLPDMDGEMVRSCYYVGPGAPPLPPTSVHSQSTTSVRGGTPDLRPGTLSPATSAPATTTSALSVSRSQSEGLEMGRGGRDSTECGGPQPLQAGLASVGKRSKVGGCTYAIWCAALKQMCFRPYAAVRVPDVHFICPCLVL